MKNQWPILILLGCAAFLAAGIVKLFQWRFAAGDVYPPYSSLRTDPLGTMAFFEGLEKMPGLSLNRDFSASDRLPLEPHTVYLHLAADALETSELPEKAFHEVRNFVNGGGRLVITFFPQTTPPNAFFGDWEMSTNRAKLHRSNSATTNSPPANPLKKIDGHDLDSWTSLETEWDFHTGYWPLPRDSTRYAPVSVTNGGTPGLARTLDWHSGMIFTNCAPAWHTIYARDGAAVVMERQFGRGSVVLASDSFFLSNEALLLDRHADLLAWLIGPNRHVVFDEAHFGILDSPGIATLMRQYHLHGLAAGLLLLAALFLWKSSTSLLPPLPTRAPDDFVAGQDATAGFINLLRRNIPAHDLFAVCYAEWKSSALSSRTVSRARIEQAEVVFQAEIAAPLRARNPVIAYQKIASLLRRPPPHL